MRYPPEAIGRIKPNRASANKAQEGHGSQDAGTARQGERVISSQVSNAGSAAPPIDVPALEIYLQGALPGFRSIISVKAIEGGVSNPTLRIDAATDAGDRGYVLRKKPPGELLRGAHQVDREYRVMAALASTDVPVPRMRLYCDDPSLLGTEFYLMDLCEGRIFRDARLPRMEREERGAIYDAMNDVLARLHGVDIDATGLDGFGKREKYYQRQIATWTRQYRAAELEPIPAMEKLIARLPDLVPKEGRATIVHGDYRLENMVFHPTEPRVIAILDWELSTLGDPLADLAYNCFLWHSHIAIWGTLDGIDLSASGIPSERDYVAQYCRRTGRERIDDWGFYMAFGVFRLAAINQGAFRRAQAGNLSSARIVPDIAGELAEQALAMLDVPNWIAA